MNDELQLQISTMLEQLSDKLGIASTKVWEWAMIQVQVQMIQSLIFIVFIILFIILTLSVMLYVKRNYVDIYERGSEAEWVVLVAILGVISSVLIIVGVYDLGRIIQYIMNPEYSAFQIIVRELSRLK